VEQEGRVDPKDPSKIVWGTSEGRGFYGDDKSRLRTTIDWEGGYRMRILANGYLPEPVLAAAPAKGTKQIDVTVRLKRGQSVHGKVLDHAGKAVAGAAVFLCGKDRANLITEGKAVHHGYPPTEDPSVTRTITNSEGRFTLRGAGAETGSVSVSTSSVDLWTVPVSALNRDVSIQLPRPGSLMLRYDIDGAEAQGTFELEFETAKRPWSGALNERQLKVANKGSILLDNLAPGKYSLWRVKTIGRRGTFGCEVRAIEVESGKTAEARFIRDRGQAIEGRVVVPDKRAKYYVVLRPPSASDNPFSHDDSRLPVFTAATCSEDGRFHTERIMPGDSLQRDTCPRTTRGVSTPAFAFPILSELAGSLFQRQERSAPL
jgi:hypothetical protein